MDHIHQWARQFLAGLLSLLALLYAVLYLSGDGRGVLVAAVACGLASAGLALWARLRPWD